MNSKKAKQLRRIGKVAKKDKKMYNQLNADEKAILNHFYEFVLQKRNASNDEPNK